MGLYCLALREMILIGLSAVLAFVVFIGIWIGALRLGWVQSPIKALFWLSPVGVPLVLILLYLLSPNMPDASRMASLFEYGLLATILYGFLCLLYLQVYGWIAYSITFQILLKFYSHPGLRMSLAELHRQYRFDEIIENKILNASRIGHLKAEQKDGVLYIDNSAFGQHSARWIREIKQFLHFGDGG